MVAVWLIFRVFGEGFESVADFLHVVARREYYREVDFGVEYHRVFGAHLDDLLVTLARLRVVARHTVEVAEDVGEPRLFGFLFGEFECVFQMRDCRRIFAAADGYLRVHLVDVGVQLLGMTEVFYEFVEEFLRFVVFFLRPICLRKPQLRLKFGGFVAEARDAELQRRFGAVEVARHVVCFAHQ